MATILCINFDRGYYASYGQIRDYYMYLTYYLTHLIQQGCINFELNQRLLCILHELKGGCIILVKYIQIYVAKFSCLMILVGGLKPLLIEKTLNQIDYIFFVKKRKIDFIFTKSFICRILQAWLMILLIGILNF